MINTESLDINEYVDQFRSNLNGLTSDIVDGNESIGKLYDDFIGAVAGQLRLTLEDAKNQIKPIEKMRRTISKNQFSDLKPEQGEIVDQIWATVKHHFENNSITKDQLFGKKKLPFLDNDTNKNNHTILEGITQCHTILNYLGYWPDEKLTKISKIYGINSDASHIAHGFFCNGILSADDRLCRKARAIYEYYGKTNHVFQVVFDK